MYTPIQLAIIERFGKKELTFGCLVTDDKNIIGHIPHIEDVFRIAHENRIYLEVMISHPNKFVIYSWGRKSLHRIMYNPSLPLLEQSEDTLQSILNLFRDE